MAVWESSQLPTDDACVGLRGLQESLAHKKKRRKNKGSSQVPRHRATVGSYGGGGVLMSEVPL